MTRATGPLCLALFAAATACGKYTNQPVPVPPGHLAFIDGNALLAASMTDGSDYHELTTMGQVVRYPAISLNSNAIAFVYKENATANSTIAMIDYDPPVGTPSTIICTAGASTTFLEPSWDSGGENIFFLQNMGGTFTIQTVPAMMNSVPITLVPSGPLMLTHFAVLTDTMLVVTAGSNSELYMLDTTTNTATDMNLQSLHRPVVSQDGTQMVFSAPGMGLVLYTFATKAMLVLDAAGENADENPWFAPTIPSSYVSFDNGVDIFAVPTTTGGVRFQLYTKGPGTQASWGN